MVDSSMIIPTYSVFVRHSADCKDANKGRDYERCGCRKWISVYDPRIEDLKQRQTHFTDANGVKQRSPFSAKTRVWAEAVAIAQALRDSHDPDKKRAAEAEAKLKAIQAEKESQSATIEHAVSAFLIWKEKNPLRRSGKLSGNASHSTMTNWRALLGNVDAQGKVLRKGHLFAWLDNVSPRPVLISDLTETLVDSFRTFTEEGKGDLTNHKAFYNLSAFFDYCRDRGKWIKANPMERLKPPSVEEGPRKWAFSDKQYQRILNVLAEREQTDDTRRLLTIIELMRWSGMAIHDATCFHRATLTGNELRYRRQKTNRTAKPNLIQDVVEMLRVVVPINGDPDQPFRNIHRAIKSDKDFWRDQIMQVFTDAGLKTIKTPVGELETGPHFLRDTFAVGQLNTQYELGQVNYPAIADALGDTVQTFVKHYKPVIEELEQAHNAAQNAIANAQQAKRDAAKQKNQGVVSIRRAK